MHEGVLRDAITRTIYEIEQMFNDNQLDLVKEQIKVLENHIDYLQEIENWKRSNATCKNN